MRIKSVRLQNFRNLEDVTITPSPDVNVIYGDNAQGKTNLIEGIWMFTGGRSLRGSSHSELIRFGQNTAALDMEFFGEGRDQTASLRLGGKKSTTLNEISLKTRSELTGVFTAVVFFPEHLSLIKEGPSVRRRFLDDAICQLMPRYGRYLIDYSRVLTQRSALLGQIYKEPSLIPLLDDWNEHFIKLCRVMLKLRRRYVERLRQKAMPIYAAISRENEKMGIIYRSSIDIDDDLEEAQALAILREQLQAVQEQDIRTGSTTIGLHRDDLEITLDQNPARAFGSQGQQRSCALALKLSECEILGEVTGEEPVILLDDVLSELDKHRREYLLRGIKGGQVFITCCDPQHLNGLERSAMIEVNGGAVLTAK